MATTEVDVLIIGGGSAGLCAGVWLAREGISYRILERRPGMLVNGQADGVQVRTVEVFESFGIAEELLKEAYHVLEATFWSDADADADADADTNGGEEGVEGPEGRSPGIRRTHSTPDTEAGLSHLPHVILNQARINALLTGEMTRASGDSNIEYGCHVQHVAVDAGPVDDPNAHCVTVTAVKDGAERVYKAKYALGSDGAHSQARKSLGFKMVGDSSDEVWGVMDVYPKTNFPDIRKKAIIKSESGNLLIIPREGDALVRMYINLSGGAAAAKDVTLAQLHEKARQIFRPYTVEFPETVWWSAYVIGQRLADAFHAHHRVFLSGDACHTHSPKAGQGMNVSLQDGYNIGWKLAAVLRGRAAPALLETYVLERQATAADLIDFDRYWSKLFSTTGDRRGHGITADHFIKAGRYTAGLATRYRDSPVTAAAAGRPALAPKLTVGMRFPSTRVVRVGDARRTWLTRALRADSRWHLVAFGGDVQDCGAAERLQKLALDLEGLVRSFTPSECDPDSVFNIVLVLSSERAGVELEKLPEVFTPYTGRWKLKDILKVFVIDNESDYHTHGHAYEAYGIEPGRGALIVIRPDQYISRIGALDDVQGIHTFFSGFLTRYN
ncbi:putative FAD binding domain-containing protein [Rosellinia necatrix]|uniref:Putative FAD binding domain-containing protein n=1 Tax=Rosellinia necatrix TaxID=77044 RepID=A0A1W2TEQ5_ROSNE|nr:putative FAD binding domain-containing protein [Rosellinia necatrix]